MNNIIVLMKNAGWAAITAGTFMIGILGRFYISEDANECLKEFWWKAESDQITLALVNSLSPRLVNKGLRPYAGEDGLGFQCIVWKI